MTGALIVGLACFGYVWLAALLGSAALETMFRGSLRLVALAYLGGAAMVGFLHGALRPWATTAAGRIVGSIVIAVPAAFLLASIMAPDIPPGPRALGSLVTGIIAGPLYYFALK